MSTPSPSPELLRQYMKHVLRCAGSAHLTTSSRVLSPDLSDADWQCLEALHTGLLAETILDAVRAGSLILDPACQHAIIRSAPDGDSVPDSILNRALETLGYGLYHHMRTAPLQVMEGIQG